ncbi:MAG: OmpA family protein [Sphingobacteriales bacterium]|nr:MAG: OmpA family protein [Sphingobacteriales bacterium]
MLRWLVILLLGICPCLVQAQRDTIRLYYDIGVSKMNETSMKAIDSAVYFERLAPGKKLAIVGYADYLGSEDANLPLSQNRANVVKDYLLKMGIAEKDIQMVSGKGEVARDLLNGTAGYITDRRVDIIPGGIPEPTKKVGTATVVVKSLPQIDISKAKKNSTITLDKLYFEPGSHKLRDASYPELLKLYNTMKENEQLKICVEGHICCLPKGNTDGYDYDSEDFNLSVNRARAVYDFLMRKGIKADRVTYSGFGMTKPIFMPELNEEQENKNRRVEIRILSK